MNVKLVTQPQAINSSQKKLAEELAETRRRQVAARQQAKSNEIAEQIKQVPIIAQQLIQGLPDFLRRTAGEYNFAFVVYLFGCEPYDFSTDSVPSSLVRNMSEYAVRRYLKHVPQRVALWGLKQGFRVGLGYIAMNSDIETWYRTHNGVVPVYMPGMFQDYIPTGTHPNLVRFSW